MDLRRSPVSPSAISARYARAGFVPGQDKRIDVGAAILFFRRRLKRRGDRVKDPTGQLLLATLERDSVRPQEQAGLDVGRAYEIVDRIESCPRIRISCSDLNLRHDLPDFTLIRVVNRCVEFDEVVLREIALQSRS